MKFGFELSIGSGFRFYPDKKLGSGAFGEMFQGIRVKDQRPVAIKIESSLTKYPQIFHEAQVLRILSGGEGIPTFYSSFPIGDCNCLIMELLGANLTQLFNFYKSKITMSHIAQIALQMISRVEFIHSRHFIHRDIKPENFLIGNNSKINTIYLIDYGLSKRFRNPKSGMHIPYKDGKSLTGTPKYVSIYTHLGIEQSRRDDLESIGYVLIYLMKGELPWDHCHAKTISDKFTKLIQKKIAISVEDLCLNTPIEMVDYFKKVQGMQFEEKPDYDMLCGLFKQIIQKGSMMANDGSLHLDYLLNVYNNVCDNDNDNDNESNEKEDSRVSPISNHNNNPNIKESNKLIPSNED